MYEGGLSLVVEPRSDCTPAYMTAIIVFRTNPSTMTTCCGTEKGKFMSSKRSARVHNFRESSESEPLSFELRLAIAATFRE